MTIIDTTLYADGALRLAKHGAGKGDTVLTLTTCGKQFTVPDNETVDLQGELDKMLALKGIDPEDAFDRLKGWFD